MKKDDIKTVLQEILKLLHRGENKILNFNQAAEYLGFSHSHLYRLTSHKIIPHYKPNGKTLFFSKAEIDQWIMQKEAEVERVTGVKSEDSNAEETEPP
jgi:excisionase family DNA binding protein